MTIPETVVFTDGKLLLPEEGMYLHGFSDDGRHVNVEVRQRNIPDLEYAGRLFLNRTIVAARSADEAAVLQLLEAAMFSSDPPANADGSEYIPGPVSTPDGLRSIRDEIVSYVTSERYVEIATSEVSSAPLPWQPWQVSPQSIMQKPADDRSAGAPASVELIDRRSSTSARAKRSQLRTRQWVGAILGAFGLPWLAVTIISPEQGVIGAIKTPWLSVIGTIRPSGYGFYCGTLPGTLSEWGVVGPDSPQRALADLLLNLANSNALSLGFITIATHALGRPSLFLWIHPVTLTIMVAVGCVLLSYRSPRRSSRHR